MNQIRFFVGVSSLLCAGFLLFCLHEEWIIISIPTHQQISTSCDNSEYFKKNINLIFYKQELLKKENIECIISPDATQTMQTVIDAWLALLEEEQLLDKKITVDSVSIAPHNKIAYLSLSQNPFSVEQSVYEKLLFIKGLMATLRQLPFKLNSIHFLVCQEELKDYHLDFSEPWPLNTLIETVS